MSLRIRKDVTISKNPNSKTKPWLVRWWGKFDVDCEKQKRYCKSFTTKKLAEKYAQSLKDDLSEGTSVERSVISLGAFCKSFLQIKKKQIAPTSFRSYEISANRLITYFGSHRTINTVKKRDAEEYISDVRLLNKKKPSSDSTRAKELRAAKLIFNVALDWDYIRKNPFKGITVGKIAKEDWFCLSPENFKALLEAIDNSTILIDAKGKIRLKTFYSVMYGCGLRFGEAVNLFWDNVDFAENRINLTNRTEKNGLPSFRLKDGEFRSIPLPEWVKILLKELQSFTSKENPYVFVTDDRYSRIKVTWQQLLAKGNTDKWENSHMVNNTNRTFRQYCRKAGVVTSKRLSVHCLRKGYGTNLANLGTPVHTLKELMGHSSIETTTKFYLKTTDANKKQAVEGLNKLIA